MGTSKIYAATGNAFSPSGAGLRSFGTVTLNWYKPGATSPAKVTCATVLHGGVKGTRGPHLLKVICAGWRSGSGVAMSCPLGVAGAVAPKPVPNRATVSPLLANPLNPIGELSACSAAMSGSLHHRIHSRW